MNEHTPDVRVKWIVYTVGVGLIPMLCRIIIWLSSNSENIPAFSSSDFVAFGLILHISIINEIEHFNDGHSNWKTIQNGISIIFICLYSVLFAVSVFSEGIPKHIDNDILKISLTILCSTSLLLSYSVYHRLSRINISRRGHE